MRASIELAQPEIERIELVKSYPDLRSPKSTALPRLTGSRDESLGRSRLSELKTMRSTRYASLKKFRVTIGDQFGKEENVQDADFPVPMSIYEELSRIGLHGSGKYMVPDLRDPVLHRMYRGQRE